MGQAVKRRTLGTVTVGVGDRTWRRPSPRLWKMRVFEVVASTVVVAVVGDGARRPAMVAPA